MNEGIHSKKHTWLGIIQQPLWIKIALVLSVLVWVVIAASNYSLYWNTIDWVIGIIPALIIIFHALLATRAVGSFILICSGTYAAVCWVCAIRAAYFLPVPLKGGPFEFNLETTSFLIFLTAVPLIVLLSITREKS